MRFYQEDEVLEIDRHLCRLHSLGAILTQVCSMEAPETDIVSLADLGRVIRDEADFTLNLIQDGKNFPEGYPLDSDQTGIPTFPTFKQRG